jgi:dTDP-glucose pyrophosphorylase
MINIVIPMAGAGSRFVKQGFSDPKPLININGVPMIRLVIENLRPKFNHQFIFICQQSHLESYQLADKLNQWAPNSIIISINEITEGAACTVLKAQKYINNSAPLMIANSDQYVDCNINKYLDELEKHQIDGLIMTMNANDPKWSFVGIEDGLVSRVVEKEVISNEATVGIYNFIKGSDFVEGANNMISKGLRVNKEFYVAPVYNQLINAGKKIGYFNIGSELNGMYGLGTPEDLSLFLKMPISKIVTGAAQ